MFTKHYIRIDEENKIVHGFSSDFEQPLETDICVNENAGRQFELFGEINPNLLDINGCHRFRYDMATTTYPHIRYSTEEEIEIEKAQKPTLDSDTSDERITELQSQVDMLTSCLLEMSEIVYGE